MPARKMLFVVFSGDACRQNHALMYALDLHAKGHEVKVVIEGEATRMMSEIGAPESRTGTLLRQACEARIVSGACARASAGCASDDPARNVTAVARSHGIGLLSELDGHASIEPFVREGYELVVL
jgi:predicted peroxiredoxin